MEQNITSSEIVKSLNEIRKIGYIKPENNAIALYCQKINHTLANLFNSTPIPSEIALSCMDSLNEICKNTHTFFSFFSKSMMDLYDWAISGNKLTAMQAETKLLNYFSHISPETVSEKKRLLSTLLDMPDITIRKNEVAKVIHEIAQHYDQNQQFNEDPNLGTLKPLSQIIHQISQSSMKKFGPDYTRTKSFFLDCSEMVKKYAPELHEQEWSKKFAPSVPHRECVPDIKEAVCICSFGQKSSNRFNHSLVFERD